MNTFTLGLIIIAYLLSLAYLGFLGCKKTTSVSDYLVGGWQMNPFVMALSYGATFISASITVGSGGVTATFGMGIQWLRPLDMFIRMVITLIFFGLRTRRMEARLNVSTSPQLSDRYYRSREIQVSMAVAIFPGIPLYAAVVTEGGAVFIEQTFQIDFNVSLLIFTLMIAVYVTAGGVKGVMYTDASQAVIMFGCILFLFFSSHRVLGMGFTKANQALTDIAPPVPEKFKALGHQGWTAIPVTGSPRWCTLVTSLILGVGIDCLARSQLMVRFMTVESSRQLNRGVFIGCFFLIIAVGAVHHAGAPSSLFFLKAEGVVATEAAEDMDKIVSYFTDRAALDWFTALFILCIPSTSVSTLSSQFHTMDASVGSDIYDIYKPRPHGKPTNVTRLGMLPSILVSYTVCYMLPNDITTRGTSTFMGICAATFLPAYFCVLYWERVTRQGVMANLWIGAIGSLFTLTFLYQREAAAMRVCRWLFDKNVLIETYPFSMIDPTLFVLPLPVAAVIIISLLTGKGEK